MSQKLWVKIIARQKVQRDVVVPLDDQDWQDVLVTACHQLDVSVPIVLPRHAQDMQSFNQARFLPDHFIDAVPFQRLEVETFDENQPKRRSQDPRNG